MALGLSVALPMLKPLQYALSAELLTNGDFATDTVWVKGTGWTIAAGVATAAAPGANSLISQALTLTPGALYQLTYTVTSYTTGLLAPRFTNAGVTVTGFSSALAAGTYTVYARLGGAADSLSFNANSTGVFSIDNVSLKRVL